MSVTIRWHGGMLLEQQRRRIQAAVLRAAVLLHTRARVLCSTPARREARRRTRQTVAGPRGSTYTLYHPSKPGQPPALRTGLGRSSITWWSVDDLTARVGVQANGQYMAYLETGTRHIARRVWLSQALADTSDAIQAFMRSAARIS